MSFQKITLMKTVIVPTDFSATATNAAHYAAKMLTGQYDASLILYHVYEKPAHADTAAKSLEKLKAELSASNAVKIKWISVEGDDVIEEIERVVHHKQANLVIMGITGRSGLEQIFMGSNTLKIVHKNFCPVLIIPPDATFNGIKNVALTSDFKNVRTVTPSVPIIALLQMFRPNLHIINVDSRHYVSLTEEYQAERAQMQKMLGEFNPEFYFIGMFDFHEAINQFVSDKKIDILITVPRNHSFLETLFRSKHTKKLVYHSTVPILAVHE